MGLCRGKVKYAFGIGILSGRIMIAKIVSHWAGFLLFFLPDTLSSSFYLALCPRILIYVIYIHIHGKSSRVSWLLAGWSEWGETRIHPSGSFTVRSPGIG